MFKPFVIFLSLTPERKYCAEEGLASVSGECLSGSYCKTGSISPQQISCLAGSYCPPGTTMPFKCPSGTFSSSTGLSAKSQCMNCLRSSASCLQCVAGFACDESRFDYPKRTCLAGCFCISGANHVALRMGNNAGICPTGHYCPEGTVKPIPCPAGTYNPSNGQSSVSACWSCTPGKYCSNTGLSNETGPCHAGHFCPGGSQKGEDHLCPAGHYCLLGSANPTPCPMGTFSNVTGLKDISECTMCLEGRYCSERGLMKPTGLCQAGYFCPIGSITAAAQTCWSGWACPEGSGKPQACPPGTYTDAEGASECSVCPAGYFCVQEQGKGSTKKPCPKGQFCPSGTGGATLPCPAGTYSRLNGLSSASQCTPCPGARYCQDSGQTAPSGLCASGYYCVSGASSPTPSSFSTTSNCSSSGIGGICPVGHFCPSGSTRPITCLPGTYNNQTGQSVCQICPEGYYCPANATSFLDFPCPRGHFCPGGSRFGRMSITQCPPGTFNEHTAQPSRLSCLSCPPGFYCSGYGNTKPTGLCAEGWYCSGNADTSQTLRYGGRCPAGCFCPSGSSAPVNCTAGYYCPVAGLSQPQGPCKAGWYCPLGSHSPTQVLCPVGHYCPPTSDGPTPCRQGTFSSSLNNDQELDCLPCTPCYYCRDPGLSTPTGLCMSGYYCPGGQTVPNPEIYLCPATCFCPEGSSSPIVCPDGTYQLQNRSSSCDICPEGYFCGNSLNPVSTLNGLICPAGFYCPAGTRHQYQFPCLVGTFNPVPGQSSHRSCIGCTPGHYCDEPGLPVPQGPCLEGYYCTGNSTSPVQHLCPQGTYCITGSARPIPCPAGTTSPDEGARNVNDCIPCYPGHYCLSGTTITGHSLPCDPGYVCLGQARVPNPTDGVTGYTCSAGHYCPRGVIREIPCGRGYFQPLQGQVTCLQCPSGRTCPRQGMEDTALCLSGHYCPTGTYDDGIPCPIGTYSNKTGMTKSSNCIPCSPGQYCDSPGLSEPSGNCLAGYLCTSGAKIAAPNERLNHPCPKGHYCEEGTILANPCPRGTLNPYTHGASLADCQPCSAGYYCRGVGLSNPTGPCMERYYCPGNVPVDVPNPPQFVCPAGFFCPNFTASPHVCPPGAYQPSIGSVGCSPCPAGGYCQGNTTVPIICPPYSYCPGSSISPIPCPDGTFTDENAVGLTKASSCSDCPIGRYCRGGHIAGLCAAGFLCISGQSTPSPSSSDPEKGKPCPIGYYCPEGSTKPQPCQEGHMIPYEGATSLTECTVCQAGCICTEKSSVPMACPPGYYCPVGSAAKGPCPSGTYSFDLGATNQTACKPCEPGYWCQTEGLSDYTRYPCPVAHFCPKGTGTFGDEYLPKPCPPGTYRDIELGADILDCWPCRAGTYAPFPESISCIQCDPGGFCPEGTQNQTPCPAGYYCTISLPRLPCPAGFYCPEGSGTPVDCPVGHYCPQDIIVSHEGSRWVIGAIKPVKCPLGYREYDGSNRSTFNNTCEPCPAGYYGNHNDRQVCLECQAGVVCLQGAITADPTSNTTDYAIAAVRSYICPKGHYCPKVSPEPTPCPKGTYNPSERAVSTDSCLKCPTSYFNHLTGQAACFTCGSQAAQPEEGQDTCICLRNGQTFQPSDSRCICTVRHRMVSKGTGECVRQLYDICREGTSRNQDGACLMIDEWAEYCSLRVCASPADFQGFDGVLGLCLCRTEDLDSVCNRKCRQSQSRTLQILCKRRAQFRITYRNGLKVDVPLNHIRRILNSRNAIEESQCPPQYGFTQPVHLVETSEKGLLGVYDPDPKKLRSLLEMNLDQHPLLNVSLENATLPVTSLSPDDSEARWSRIRQSADSPINGTLFSGILNPTTCIHIGSIILFIVSSDHYPVYDTENLYNTNSEFDWGAFRGLVEEMRLNSSTSSLFSYRFSQSGVHVFQLSSNPNKKMYVRVMPVGGQCYDKGFFFPTTPRNIIRMGISRTPNLPFKPDWLVISSLLLTSVIMVGVCAGLLLLFRKCSWPEKAAVAPTYRSLHKAYNFDDYSSKGAAIAVKKFHRSLRFKEQTEENEADREGREDSILKNDEFWDYEQQIDLEFFNTNTFYQILLKQSLAVSVRLSQHKNEVKALYQKIAKETDSLKEHWMERMNFAGRRKVINSTDMEMYEKMCHKIRLEIERRKHIGVEFEEILNKQQQLLHSDWSCREEHHVTFNTALREAVWLLEEHTDNMDNDGKKTLPSTTDHQRVAGQIEALLLQMSDAITSECQRLNAWAVLGEGTGAQLVSKGSSKGLSKEELIGADGTIRACDLLQVDQLTGLVTPNPDAVMLLANKYTMSVPRGLFLHPQTGRLLPIAGNVCYGSTRSKLLPVTDSTTGLVCQSEEHLIPYVPYPLCPGTGLPMKLQLRSLHHQSELKLGGPMGDAETGIEVPILAVTIHPQTGLVRPLGGMYISPVTNMLATIEIGAPMVCEKTGQMVPILGIGLDNSTGMVVPLGGVLESSNTPLILGDSFSEPLSGKSARISGAYVEETRVLPHAGGYQALLDAAMLACEIQVLDLLKDYKDCVAVQQSEVPSCPQKQRSLLRDALDGLVKARTRSWAHMIHTAHNLERQRKEAKDLADNGGSIGMLPFPSTGLLVSAVIGMQIPDPGGSDLEVPVLGVEYDGATGQLIPLAGTMEDPDGKGLIPITLGARSIDPLTGEIGPVVGAYIDPQTRIVMPVTQSSGASIRRKPPVELLNALEEELSYRRVHWHHQRQKEEAVFGALKSLLQEISDTKSDWKFEKVAEKVKALENTIDLLQDCAQNEAQRRHTEELHFASIMPTDIVLLVSQVDQEEVEQQLLYLAMAQTFLEKVTQFIQKMDQDEARRRGQLQELLQGVNQQAEEVSRLRYQQVKILLTQEFQKNMMSRWTALDIVYIRLEHLRDLAELCVLEAKGILFGGLYRFGDYQLIGSRAAGHFHGAPDSTNKKMFPLLKQLISLLEADRNFFLSPDNLNLVSRNEKDWAKLLPQCPLFKLLKEINEQLKANQETEELSQAKDHQQCTNQTKAKYQEADRPYIDIVDAQWSCEGKLLPLTLEKISVTELAVYRFGIFIVQLVKRSINAPEINLLLASSLPVNNYTRNAFRNSFFYQHSQKTLFIRRQQLASVGDLSLLLVHCLAHLAADELSDDSNPLFLKLFHRALKALFKDMFSTRLRIPPALNAHEPRASMWDNLLRKEFYPEIYTDVISDLLNVTLKDPKTMALFAEHVQQCKESGDDNKTGTSVKDQPAEKINEHLQGQSEIQNNNGVCFEIKSELDPEDIEEKIDNITIELAAVCEAEQKTQESMVSVSKKRAFLKEIEELEAELESRKK